MKFNIVNSQAIYHLLVNTPAAAERERIFRQELVEPFSGLVKVFGGSDGLSMFGMWGMSPEQLAGEQHEWAAGLIEALAQADAWKRAAQALDKGWAAFAGYADCIPLESITFALLIADMSRAPQAGGYTGFGGIPGWIMTVYGEPTPDNLKKIEACTVHELHHNLGGAAGAVFAKPGKTMNDVTVGEYMIGEGLAESFAAELYGEDMVGPWVTGFDESQLERTKAIFRQGLNRAGFNVVRGYIFGGELAGEWGFEPVNVPLYAGYALGYRVVQAYLKRAGKRVVETTFVPAEEIIAESGFFD